MIDKDGWMDATILPKFQRNRDSEQKMEKYNAHIKYPRCCYKPPSDLTPHTSQNTQPNQNPTY